MQYKYRTQGVCSQSITFDLEGDVVRNISFFGGCDGNLKGISSLVKGMKAQEVIKRCGGIRCGMKSTSCPDQLASALEEYLILIPNKK